MACRTVSLNEFEECARRRLPRALFGYVSDASEEKAAYAANRRAIDALALVPRALRNTSGRSMATTLLGQPIAAPFGIAPMGLAAMMAYRGDLMLARAADAAGIPMVVSGTSLVPLEEIVAAAPSAWFQAYLPGEFDWIEPMLGRITRAGYRTLVLTVDVPVVGNRGNIFKLGFSTPFRPSWRLAFDGATHPRWLAGVLARTLVHHGMPHFENASAGRGAPIFSRHAERNFGARDGMAWEHLALIRDRWKGRLVIKGLLHPEDVRMARAQGADAAVLSNHGGRQLDSAVAPLEMLAESVALAGPMEIIIDGGFRRGGDILKALALGARSVLIGRPFLYAAASAGEAGVAHAIALLRAEIDRDMAMLGVCTLDEIGPEHLRERGA